MQSTTEQNKAIVLRFNKEFIEKGDMAAFREIVADDVINHSAPEGAPNGPDSMMYFLQNILRAGFPDLQVEILAQVAEKDLVTTRKQIKATHTGEIMGISASGKAVEINIIDIIRLKDGKYIEHWGASNFSDVVAQISPN